MSAVGADAAPSVRPTLNRRLEEFGTTIFAEMSALAVATGSINLGQGFPDTDGPEEVKQSAIDAINAGFNQYPPGRGIPELLAAIAGHQRRFYGIELDPGREVLVTAGATEAITATVLALCEPGDEVILFEPYYDSYAAAVAMAGATRRVARLEPPTWRFDPDQLRSLVTPRTRMILLNTPHNPTGKVFNPDELETIAALAIEHDLFVLTDEVYEHLVFDGAHRPISTFDEMRERTVTVSSAGKAFSFTGWKIGWATSTPELVSAVQTAKQFLTYVNGAPLQHAVVTALALPDPYFEQLREELRRKRDLLARGLAELGFRVLPTAGTYFLNTDVAPLTDLDSVAFCRQLPERCGVVAIPVSVFCDSKEIGRSLVRWAFCKREPVLEEALDRLASLRR